jgi:hypothetical protein
MNGVAGEHRRVARAEVSLVAKVRPVRSTVYLSRTVTAMGVAVMDISTLGLSFLTDLHFDVDELVEVELSWASSELFFHGVVRHVEPRGPKGGLSTVGIQYLITASTKHAIETLRRWLQTAADISYVDSGLTPEF